MTRAQFRYRIACLCGAPADATTGAISHPRLTNAVAEAYLHEIALDLAREAFPGHLVATQTSNLVTNSANYLLPAGLLEGGLISVKSRMLKLYPRDRSHLDACYPDWEARAANANQLYYYHAGVNTTSGSDYGRRLIGLWPKPSANSTSALVVQYLRKPFAFSEGQYSGAGSTLAYVEHPEEMHDAMAHGAAARWLEGALDISPVDPGLTEKYRAVYEAKRASYVAIENAHDPYRVRRGDAG